LNSKNGEGKKKPWSYQRRGTSGKEREHEEKEEKKATHVKKRREILERDRARERRFAFYLRDVVRYQGDDKSEEREAKKNERGSSEKKREVDPHVV